jgi:hypothetical protein
MSWSHFNEIFLGISSAVGLRVLGLVQTSALAGNTRGVLHAEGRSSRWCMSSSDTREGMVRGTVEQDSIRSSITIEAHRQIGLPTTPELDLPLLQIGGDRTCASCPARSLLPFAVQPPEHIPVPGDAGYLVLTSVRRRRPTPGYPWTVTAKYEERPTGHHVRVFCGRSTRTAPHLFAILRPADGQVFSLPTVILLLNALSRALRLPLMLSSLEIAADFADTLLDTRSLASQFWVPRIPGHRCVGEAASATVYRGSRSSAFQAKVYPKHEGTLHAVRIEFTFRRKALRTLHVDGPDSLGRVDWGVVCPRRARLVTVPMDSQRNTALSVAAREAFASGGIFAVQDRLGTPGMRWLSRHIVSSPMQHTLEAALSAWGRLPADAPEEIAHADFIDSDTLTALLRSVTDASRHLATILSSEATLPAESEDLMGDPMRHAEVVVAGSLD